jgi:Xaa-Pro aminopeptidase
LDEEFRRDLLPAFFWENWGLNKLASVLLLAGLGLPASAKMPTEEFRARRAALRQSLDGTLLLMGQTEGRDALFGFAQDSNFYYLTGWTEPGAALLMTPTREVLLLPHHDAVAERYHGKRWSSEDAGVQSFTGFEDVLPIEKLESQLDQSLSDRERVYSSGTAAVQLRSRYPFRDISEAAPLVTKLRVKKSAAELAAIQYATDISIEAHRAAWKRIVAGQYEYQVAATFSNSFLEAGCERPAYAPIIASGPNGAILHYSSNHRRMDRGEAVVMDAAAECDGYASDITRTIPVGGKFSARQREIYEIVLGAQKAAIAAIKPGARLSGTGDTLTKVAKDYIDAHGKDLHGEALGKYFTHGIGHQVGLEVHDPNVDTPLEAGMVITIEPGIYIEEEHLGVRIEDVLLVTEKGSTVLSAALAKEPDEIEKAVAK